MSVVPLLVGVSNLLKIICGVSLFTFFIIVHVWFPSPQKYFLFVECPLSQILETSKEE